MKSKENTLIFIDEIQAYPHLLTLLKFCRRIISSLILPADRFLGVTLSQTINPNGQHPKG